MAQAVRRTALSSDPLWETHLNQLMWSILSLALSMLHLLALPWYEASFEQVLKVLLVFREHELPLGSVCKLLKHEDSRGERYHRALDLFLLHNAKGIKDVTRVAIGNA